MNNAAHTIEDQLALLWSAAESQAAALDAAFLLVCAVFVFSECVPRPNYGLYAVETKINCIRNNVPTPALAWHHTITSYWRLQSRTEPSGFALELHG